MEDKTFKQALARYNKLMFGMCLEFLTIGTDFSEGEDKAHWNIRDLVAECDYQLSTYYESGHANEELRHSDEYDRRKWRAETGKYRRFIDAYKPYIKGVKCYWGHCSKYDN